MSTNLLSRISNRLFIRSNESYKYLTDKERIALAKAQEVVKNFNPGLGTIYRGDLYEGKNRKSIITFKL
jgi:hypothetical protein